MFAESREGGKYRRNYYRSNHSPIESLKELNSESNPHFGKYFQNNAEKSRT